jgi:hypothetical protein
MRSKAGYVHGKANSEGPGQAKTATLFVDNATIKDVWVARAGVNYKF